MNGELMITSGCELSRGWRTSRTFTYFWARPTNLGTVSYNISVVVHSARLTNVHRADHPLNETLRLGGFDSRVWAICTCRNSSMASGLCRQSQ